jgi:hypothetical protein
MARFSSFVCGLGVFTLILAIALLPSHGLAQEPDPDPNGLESLICAPCLVPCPGLGMWCNGTGCICTCRFGFGVLTCKL